MEMEMDRDGQRWTEMDRDGDRDGDGDGVGDGVGDGDRDGDSTLATRCLWPEPYGMAARSSVPGVIKGHGMMALTEAPFPLVA